MAKTTTGRSGIAAAAKPVIPETMKAAVVTRHGGPEVLEIREVPVPRVGPHDVLIRLATVGVGIWDVQARRGDWSAEGETPQVLGSDGAGVIVARGSRVRGLEVGDEVYAYSYMNPKGGFHAQYVCVSEETAALKPTKLDLDRAGAIATTGITALEGIGRLGPARRGVVLVFGATGGVGTLAVQFAKYYGAIVLATASFDEGAAYLHAIGADAVFDARKGGVEKALAAVGAEGLDGVIAFAGGPDLQKLLERVRPGGRVVYPNGVEPPPEPVEGLKVTSYDGLARRKAFDMLTRVVEQLPYFDARLDGVFPFERIADAHARVEKGHVLGKVVVQVDSRWPAWRKPSR